MKKIKALLLCLCLVMPAFADVVPMFADLFAAGNATDTLGRPKYIGFVEEFTDDYALTSNLPVAASSPWVGTATSTGTVAFTDAQYGSAVMTAAATTDNDGVQIQGDETIQLGTNQTTWLRSRIKVSDADQSHVFWGLAITDTTLVDGADGTATLTISDGFGFLKVDGGTTVYIVAIKDSVIVASAQVYSGVADDTYAYYELVCTTTSTAGEARFSAKVDGVPVGFATTLTAPNDELLAPAIGFKSGSTSGTVSMTVDNFGWLQTRSY